MKNKNIAAAVSIFFLTCALSVPSFATSEALDQLKAQAESLGAAAAVPVQTPAAAPAVQNPGSTASTPPQSPADVPAQAAAFGPQSAFKAIESRVGETVGRFLYSDLFPRLEPKGAHYMENGFNQILVEYTKIFDKKECPLDLPLGNLHEITPGVYRSGMPTQAGFTQLKQMGVKTVLSLLRPGDTLGATEERAVADLGMSYVDIPIDPTLWPPFQQIDQALAIMTDPSKQPVLLHCTCGNDRTGIFAASYRIVIQGWTPERAAAEAKAYYWMFPALGDLSEFLSSYARYRAGTAPPQPAPAAAAK